MNLQMFKLGLEKAEEPEIKLSTSVDHQKSKRVPEKTSIPALLTMPKNAQTTTQLHSSHTVVK